MARLSILFAFVVIMAVSCMTFADPDPEAHGISYGSRGVHGGGRGIHGGSGGIHGGSRRVSSSIHGRRPIVGIGHSHRGVSPVRRVSHVHRVQPAVHHHHQGSVGGYGTYGRK